MIMSLLSRSRRGDAVFTEGHDPLRPMFCRRGNQPYPRDYEDDVDTDLPIQNFWKSFPIRADRMKILARDAPGPIDVFQKIWNSSYEFLFGMNVYSRCPEGNHADDLKSLSSNVWEQLIKAAWNENINMHLKSTFYGI